MDTTKELGHISTVASLWVPTDLVPKFFGDLAKSSSKLYGNPDPSVRTIISMISPSLSSSLLASNPIPSGLTTTLPLAPITLLTPVAPARSSSDLALIGSPTPAASTETSPDSTKLSAGLKVIIGVLVPGGIIIFLALFMGYRRQQRQKKHAISNHPADKITKEDCLPPFFQQKAELDGENQRHEMSAEERWIELPGKGREELPGEQIQIELHGDIRHELQGEDIQTELHRECRHELQGEEIGIKLQQDGRQEQQERR